VRQFWTDLAPLVPFYLPGLLSFVVALAGVLALRRNEALQPAVAAAAAMLGWMLLVPMPRSWVMPRVAVEYLVVPAMVAMLWAAGRLWVRGRLLSPLRAFAPGFAAWWLAGSGVARGEFWRVWFATVGLDWLLRRMGGRAAGSWVLVAGTVLLGLLVGRAPLVWVGAAVVLAAAGLGVAVLRPAATLGGVILPMALVAIDLGTGVLVRGRIGFMDLVCGGAVFSPLAVRGLTPLVGRRLGRAGGVLCMVASAMLMVGLAWAVDRFVRL